MGWLKNSDLFTLRKDKKTLSLNPYAWKLEPRTLCSTAKPSHIKVGNALTDDYHDHLRLVRVYGLDKALDMASEEPGEIDPYSILTPPCTATSSSSSQQKKRWRVLKNLQLFDKQAYELQSSPKQLMTKYPGRHNNLTCQLALVSCCNTLW
ncbi:hypothetical protein RHSIM_Rhsim01G0088700 [Rhododendron simsii]|uniref:Uncharacterized protein n=1 Tax=Rhododendron simsii TaxID=118357 RepID=A0A834HF60_RHOSS|nr:hypothetical protein RHSIM_Rhsim01G0088700 [Rhododendron simsii]